MPGCGGGQRFLSPRRTFSSNHTPFTLHLTPYSLHPTPYTLNLAPYTLHPTPYNPHPTHHTLWVPGKGGGGGFCRRAAAFNTLQLIVNHPLIVNYPFHPSIDSKLSIVTYHLIEGKLSNHSNLLPGCGGGGGSCRRGAASARSILPATPLIEG